MAEKKWRASKSGGGGGISASVGGSSSSLGGGGGSSSTGSSLFRLKFRRPESRSRSAGPQSHSICSEPGTLAATSTGTAISAADLSQLSIYQWGNNEVAIWLASLQLEEYREDFIRHDIRGPELLTLERRDLKELGIHKVGHIKRIQQAILEIKENTRSQHHLKQSSWKELLDTTFRCNCLYYNYLILSEHFFLLQAGPAHYQQPCIFLIFVFQTYFSLTSGPSISKHKDKNKAFQSFFLRILAKNIVMQQQQNNSFSTSFFYKLNVLSLIFISSLLPHNI